MLDEFTLQPSSTVCRLTNLDLQRKEQLMRDQLEHAAITTMAREYMNTCSKRPKEILANANAVLEPHDPQSGPDMAHYGFDFAQQVYTK